MLNFLTYLWISIDESSFWSNFVSGLLLLVLSTFFIPWYLDWRKRPQLELFFVKDNLYSKSLTIDLSDIQLFNLDIQNRGSRDYKGVYYSLYLPESFKINFKPANDQVPQQTAIPGASYSRVAGMNHTPIFPYRSNSFCPEIVSWQFPAKKGKYFIYYYISTAHGMSPKCAKKLDHFSQKPLSSIFKYMNALEINIV